jgi:transposase-like protein
MKFPKKVVKGSVKLRHKGLTLRDTRLCVTEIFEISVKSDSTIWYWSQRFCEEFKEVIHGLGNVLYGDETLVKTFAKGVFLYFWALRDLQRHCIVGYHVSEHRTLRDTKLFFWEARRKFPVDYLPESIRTDSMPAYRFAISSVFSHNVRHDKYKSFKHGNNVIENFFRCKRRFPRFRTPESARKYIAHWVYEYNKERLQIWTSFIIRRLKIMQRKRRKNEFIGEN